MVLLHQNGLQEELPGHIPHMAVKVNGKDLLDSVKLLHQPRPILGRTEQGHRFAGNQGIGMAVKGQGGGAAAQPVRLLAAPGQELAMAQMDAVKEAQSNDAWLVQISSPRKSF